MDYVKQNLTRVRRPVTSQQTFPPSPYPVNYVHSVINELEHVVEAVHTLRDAGYPDQDIHVMTSWDFIKASEQKNRGGHLLTAIRRFIAFFDEGFGDTYLHAAQQGKHILAVRLTRKKQRKHLCDLLTAHYAHQIKYVGTWAVSDLHSTPAYVRDF